MAQKKQEVANRLLDGLVDYLLARLAPAQLDALIVEELDFVLDKAAGYSLNQWVQADQIFATAQKYAVQMDISGAIPELVGDMVEQFYDHAIQSERTVEDVIDEDVVMALLDKVLEIPLSRQGMAWLGRIRCCWRCWPGALSWGLRPCCTRACLPPCAASWANACRSAGWPAWKRACRSGCCVARNNC